MTVVLFLKVLQKNVLIGNLHEMLVELEGMGGGGKLQLEVSACSKSRSY